MLLIKESYINATRGHRFGDSDLYEPHTDNIGRLFRECQKEYGRCVSKVYVDRGDKSIAIGWVFEGRQEYEDTHEPYIREVWVTLYDAPDTVTREHHYHAIP